MSYLTLYNVLVVQKLGELGEVGLIRAVLRSLYYRTR